MNRNEPLPLVLYTSGEIEVTPSCKEYNVQRVSSSKDFGFQNPLFVYLSESSFIFSDAVGFGQWISLNLSLIHIYAADDVYQV